MTVESSLPGCASCPGSRTARVPGCKEYCEREIDDVEVTARRVYLDLGVHRDDRHDQTADQR
jgi:hypothetical protein